MPLLLYILLVLFNETAPSIIWLAVAILLSWVTWQWPIFTRR